MKARFRSKLTQEVLLQDYSDRKTMKAADAVVKWKCAAYGFLILLMCIPHPVFCTICLFGVLALICARIIAGLREEKQTVDFDLTEETVRKIEKNWDSEGDLDYQIWFDTCSYKSGDGMLNLNLYTENIKVGDRYYIVKVREKLTLIYSMEKWRVNDVTTEEIAQEICEEEELIGRMIECERFPRLTYRKKYHSEEAKRYCQVIMQKSEEEKNLLERFAAKHFFGDTLEAIEFIMRYCPAELKNKAFEEFTEEQRDLLKLVVKHLCKE